MAKKSTRSKSQVVLAIGREKHANVIWSRDKKRIRKGPPFKPQATEMLKEYPSSSDSKPKRKKKSKHKARKKKLKQKTKEKSKDRSSPSINKTSPHHSVAHPSELPPNGFVLPDDLQLRNSS